MTTQKKVLIIDPSPIFRKTLKDMLQSSDLHLKVDEAKNIAEAEFILSTQNPNLVFFEIALPRNNGIAFIEKIKYRYPDTTIVVLTYHDSIEHRESSIKHGAHFFISKTKSSGLNLMEIVNAKVQTYNPA